jgi:hypothetical protein
MASADILVGDEIQYEHQLEDGLRLYLDGHFIYNAATPYRGNDRVIANTARGGKRNGKWSQPDLTLVALQRLPLQKRIEIELFTFELKRCNESDVDSVFEAVAHTRYAHYAYLAWHRPRDGQSKKSKQQDVEANCRAHGIGLIIFSDPKMSASYEIVLAPTRKNPHPVDVEQFLSDRFKADDYNALVKRLSELEFRT